MNPDRRRLRLPKVERILQDICLRTGVCVKAGTPSLTFTRSTTGLVEDCDGILRTAKINEIRCRGARRVENRARFSEDLMDATWLKLGTGTPVSVSVAAIQPPIGIGTAFLVDASGAADDRLAQTFGSLPSGTYTISMWARSVAGTGTWPIALNNTYATPELTTTWRRVTMSIVLSAAGSINAYPVHRSGGGTLTQAYITGVQFELLSLASTGDVPSEYVSTDVLALPMRHGAFADGVKYFDYQNGNTVASNIVTEARGIAFAESSLMGCMSEPSETNYETGSTSYNLTLLSGVTGQTDPAGSNLAATFTETGGSGAHFRYQASYGSPVLNEYVNLSTYIKRGTANKVQLTGSGNWSAANSYANFDLVAGTMVSLGAGALAAGIQDAGNGWYRIWMTTQVTVATSGAAIIVATIANDTDTRLQSKADQGWTFTTAFGQLTKARVPTSYIPTTVATVTRGEDFLTHAIPPSLISTRPTEFALTAEVSIDWYSDAVFNNIWRSAVSNDDRMTWFRYQGSITLEKRIGNVAYGSTVTYTPALRTLFKTACHCSNALGHQNVTATLYGNYTRTVLDKANTFAATGAIGNAMCGTVKRFTIYDSPLSASRLRELTQ